MATPRKPLPQAALQEVDNALIALASAALKLEPLLDDQNLATMALASRASAEIHKAIMALNNAKGEAKKTNEG